QRDRWFHAKPFAPTGAERIHIDFLAPAVATSSRLTDRHPVGGPIAGTLKTARIDEGFHQNWAPTIALLPVLRQACQHQRQHMRRQILHVHAWQNQKTVVRRSEEHTSELQS